jgi:hypothetical protein
VTKKTILILLHAYFTCKIASCNQERFSLPNITTMSLKMFAAVVGAGVGIVFGVKYLTERIYPESQRAKIDGPIYTYVETKETLDLRPKYKLIDTKEKTTSEN